jgi:hypothetical protein
VPDTSDGGKQGELPYAAQKKFRRYHSAAAGSVMFLTIHALDSRGVFYLPP